MKDKKRDNFDEIFRERLSDHQVVAGEHNWDAIRSGIGRKTYPLWIKLSSFTTVAAAVIIAVIFLTKPRNVDPVMKNEPIAVIENSERESKIDEEKEEVLEQEDVVEQEDIVEQKEAPVKKIEVVQNETIQIAENISIEDIIIEEPKIESEPEIRSIYDSDFYSNNIEEEYQERERRRKGWEVGASLLSSTTGSNESTPLLYSSAPNTYTASDMKALSFVNTPEALAPASYTSPSDTKYSPPISAGISVRKYFTDRLALESGIIYSPLSTDRKYGDDATETLKTHYLGIPLNIVGDICKIGDKAKIYVSIGGSAEKGISSKYIKHNNLSGGKIVTNKSVPGIQWSVNAYIGISYDIFRICSIYIEPRFSYYFDNDQPLSIRTEKNFIVGLNAGVRFML